MNNALDELNAIKKANELKDKNQISESMRQYYLDEHIKKEKHLIFIDNVKEILKANDFKTEISILEANNFSINSKIKDKKGLISISYHDKKYTLTKNDDTKLVNSDPDKILKYLRTSNYQEYNFFIFLLIVVLVFLIFMNAKMPLSKVSILNEDMKARVACTKIIQNVKDYEIISQKIDKNEIQVKFTNLLTNEYLVGIYILDEKICMQTRY